jgi:uncharacterized protein YjeT (DUF2065 family)
MEKKLFDEIILLIMSLTFSYFGLSLGFAPRQYQAIAARLERPMAHAPTWVIRGVGIGLILIGLLFFSILILKWP